MGTAIPLLKSRLSGKGNESRKNLLLGKSLRLHDDASCFQTIFNTPAPSRISNNNDTHVESFTQKYFIFYGLILCAQSVHP